MITIDYLLIDTLAKNIVGLKVNALVEREKSDIVAHHILQKNEAKHEYLLDFILSDGNAQALNAVEFNGYRYKNYTDKTGHKGVLLFAISERAYDNDITSFMQDLREQRMKTLKSFTDFNFPDVFIN